MTYARASWIGVLFGLALLTIGMLRKKAFYRVKDKQPYAYLLTKRMYVYCFFIICFLIFVSALFQFKLESIHGRLHIYKVVLLIIKENFIFGIGFGKIFSLFNEYQGVYFSKVHTCEREQLLATNTFESFNSLMQIVGESGVLGIAFCLFIIYFITDLCIGFWKKPDWSTYQIASAASVIGIFASSMFSNPFHHSPILLNFLIALAIIPKKNYLFNSNKNFNKFLICFIVILCFAVIAHEIKRLNYLVVWKRAYSEVGTNGFDSANAFYSQVENRLDNNGSFLYNYGVEAFIAERDSLSIRLLHEATQYYTSSELYTYLGSAYAHAKDYESAEKYFKHAILITPAMMYPKYQLFQLYDKWGRSAQATEVAKRILCFPVKVPSIATRQMQDSARAYLRLQN